MATDWTEQEHHQQKISAMLEIREIQEQMNELAAKFVKTSNWKLAAQVIHSIQELDKVHETLKDSA
jgi:hypothetical protein